MEKLDIRFDRATKKWLSELEQTGIGTKSEVARAAMTWGLLKIQKSVDEFGADIATKSVQDLGKPKKKLKQLENDK